MTSWFESLSLLLLLFANFFVPKWFLHILFTDSLNFEHLLLILSLKFLPNLMKKLRVCMNHFLFLLFLKFCFVFISFAYLNNIKKNDCHNSLFKIFIFPNYNECKFEIFCTSSKFFYSNGITGHFTGIFWPWFLHTSNEPHYKRG